MSGRECENCGSLCFGTMRRSTDLVSIRKVHILALTCHNAFPWADDACIIGSLMGGAAEGSAAIQKFIDPDNRCEVN